MDMLASVMARYVSKNKETAIFSYDTYRYCFLILLESLAGVITGMLIAILLDMKFEAMVFFGTFFILRSYAGGIHCETFGKCYCGSMGIILGTLCTIKYLQIPSLVSLIVLLASISILILMEPAEIKNRKVEADENNYFKRRLRQVLMVIFFLFVFFVIAEKQRYANLVAITTMVVCILGMIGRWIKQ